VAHLAEMETLASRCIRLASAAQSFQVQFGQRQFNDLHSQHDQRVLLARAA
jgi:hypothetical protein